MPCCAPRQDSTDGRVKHVAGSQVLVPQRIEPGRRTRELSDAQVAARQSGSLHRGSAEFRAVIADLQPARRQILEHLADWADTLEAEGLVKLATYRGKAGVTTLLPRLAGDDAGLVSICCDNGSASVQFRRSVFDRRAPLSIPAVEEASSIQIRQGNTTHKIPESLRDALTQAYREAATVMSV
jgi:hypothetical protein